MNLFINIIIMKGVFTLSLKRNNRVALSVFAQLNQKKFFYFVFLILSNPNN